MLLRPKVLVTRKIPDRGINFLKTQCDVDVSQQNGSISRKELLKKLKSKKYDALLCLLTDKIDDEILDAAGSNLKIVANYAVGFDNIDLKACTERGVIVTNTPNVLNQAVAEHTVALMMAIARRIPEADKWARKGNYKGWDPNGFIGTEFNGKTLGIIGAGRIGTVVARICNKGFNMKVLYHDINKNPFIEQEANARFADMATLLRESDFVSLHVPALESTKHMINHKELAMMKKTAYLINTARGPVIQEDALLHALENKTIAGAALDVFECEPKLVCHPNEYQIFTHLDNIVISPHIASATIEARQGMSELAAKNIIAVLNGEMPITQVNTDLKVNAIKKGIVTDAANYFYARNGMVVKNLTELQSALEKMDDSTFNFHVNANKNDFVNWIRNTIKDQVAVALLEKAKTRSQAVNAIKHRLKVMIVAY
ncbi:D-glycerate dehydrogenase [Candidatus Woesearchaeota archaeon]|nr:D-glycerate dehydrogenase [Candidatus Woesearchaeota archaeon]